MSTVTKKDLVESIAKLKELKRGEVKDLLQLFLDLIVDELAHGNRIEFRDFGVFEVKERAARTAQNPKTLQRVQVPARRAVKFKAGRVMREALDAREQAQSNGQAPSIEVKPRRPGAVV